MNDVARTFVSTWRALLAPTRALPIAALALPLVVSPWTVSTSMDTFIVSLLAVTSFVSLAPALWRVLFPTGRAPLGLPLTARLVVFTAIGAVTLGAIVLGGQAAGLRSLLLSDRITFTVSTALFVVGGFGLGRDIEREIVLARERTRATLLEREAEHARLLALKNHLDPHFIFNTLNAIAEWCRQDGVVAERAIVQLSQLLRAVFAGVQESAWPLSRERELLEELAALHLLRDPGLFTLEVHATPAALAVRVPPLLLLPLVENAVKHGPAAGHRGLLSLSFAVVDAALAVTVENPGPYRGPRAGGEGVRMVRSRLALVTLDAGRLELREVADAAGQPRTRATLTMPLAAHAVEVTS